MTRRRPAVRQPPPPPMRPSETCSAETEDHLRSSQIGQPQQQKRVGGIAGENESTRRYRCADGRAPGRRRASGPGRQRRLHDVGHAREQVHGHRTGDGGQGEQHAIPAWKRQQKHRRQERTDDGPRVIHGPVEAVDQAARAVVGRGGQQRVARRAADPLAGAVGEAQHQHDGPAGRQADERAYCRGEHVARQRDRLASPPPVRHAARRHLQHTAHRLRDPLDDAQRHRAGSEHAGQKERQQRIDGLGRGVGRQADPAEQPHRPRQVTDSHGPAFELSSPPPYNSKSRPRPS
jgi:hypothetical protein